MSFVILKLNPVVLSSLDACDLRLDPTTAHRKLHLSSDKRKATVVAEARKCADRPERFDCWFQLLCRSPLTGRCYWEVERKGAIYVGLTYRGIRRRGQGVDCRLGGDDTSWSLYCSDDNYFAWHDDRRTAVCSDPSSTSNRVAVYVDCPAGTLSFYRVSSDSLIHLHTLYTTVTEPLYPGFRFGFGFFGSSVSLLKMEDKESP